ncbi:unnamed protein product [Didymodactylos carnosus]|uniref:Uncharacterized protein n=1 Tax=Didymodactylos carnosus TaxID=1234261 RepID=A0A814C9T7_9BILA|nr:unnamed protein product [Didymodactylos carnosus]CAF0937130.1 unnamed protein product [Didymodactylos carnosus]CAF3510462.1 unnamed protein product [Didymodactylos carnosus]CAF3714165.1 unnamed protein product [Didymodactylos carnosus]
MIISTIVKYSERCYSSARALPDGSQLVKCKCGMEDYSQYHQRQNDLQQHQLYRQNIPDSQQITESFESVRLSNETVYPPQWQLQNIHSQGISSQYPSHDFSVSSPSLRGQIAPQNFMPPFYQCNAPGIMFPFSNTDQALVQEPSIPIVPSTIVSNPHYKPEGSIIQIAQNNGISYDSGDHLGNSVSRPNVILSTSEVNDAAPSTTSKTTTPTMTIVAEATESTPVTDDPSFEPVQSTGLIYNLKNYRYNSFLFDLYCDFDPVCGQFGSPTGICTLPDDRLLVANFDCDSMLLIDISGVVHEIYKNLVSPKAVVHFPFAPQAVVATRRDLAQLNALNLVETGKLSLQHVEQERTQQRPKVYPYSAYFLSNLIFVLTNHKNVCSIQQYDSNFTLKSTYNLPPSVQSYSLFVDNEQKCLIADTTNHRLISVDKLGQLEEHECESIHQPYSFTFLSNGAICITDRTNKYGTNGGIGIISTEPIYQS